jgi:hypothetical protein
MLLLRPDVQAVGVVFMAKTTATEEGIDAAKKFINDHKRTEISDDRLKIVVHVNQTDYIDFMKDNGVEPEVLTTIEQITRNLIGGGMNVAKDEFTQLATTYTEAGDAVPNELRAQVKISRPDGALVIGLHGHDRNRNPRTGEPIDSFGRVSVDEQSKRLIPTDIADSIRSDIEALYSKNS